MLNIKWSIKSGKHMGLAETQNLYLSVIQHILKYKPGRYWAKMTIGNFVLYSLTEH